MSEQDDSPALKQTIQEVQGRFPDDATMQDALGRLTIAGYDRADFSLPEEQEGTTPTPNESAENPVDDIDKAQMRTMGTSMAGYAGAVAVAGATLATGGAALLAVAGAAAVGAGAGIAANAAGNAVDQANVEDRNARGAAGTLILAVRARSPEKAAEIETLMRQAGATEVSAVTRGSEMLTAGVSAASWTGG